MLYFEKKGRRLKSLQCLQINGTFFQITDFDSVASGVLSKAIMRKCLVVVAQHISASPQIRPALDSLRSVILLYRYKALQTKQLKITIL